MSKESETQGKISSLENRVKRLEEALFLNSDNNKKISKTKKISAKEFLMSKAANTDTKKALVLGYFLEYMEGMQSFNTTDLETVFRAAKSAVAKNMNSTVNKNIAQDFMMEAAEKKDSKKAWCLTTTGEKQVETELNKQGE